MADGLAFKWRVIQSGGSGASIFLASKEELENYEVEMQSVSAPSRAGRLFTWEDAQNPQPSSPVGRFIAQLLEWGFNGLALEDDLEKHPNEMRGFARYLKENGMGMILRREWCETEIGYSIPITESEALPRTSRKLCPYNDEVRDYWVKRIARDYELAPDLEGYRMNGTEFYFINGAPWMCDCAECRKRSGRERTRDAICLVANLFAPHGGTLFWETCSDDPWGQRHETVYFKDMTGELPDNAFIFIKRLYFDYHPHWPRHPLFEFITKDAEGNSPYMTSIPLPNEWMGVHSYPYSHVDEWSAAFRDMKANGQQGVWLYDIVEPGGYDPPLNKVNWYAVARYMRDPNADPGEVKLSWAQAQYGEKAAPTVLEVLYKMTEALVGMFYFDGLMTANHGHFSNIEYLDSHTSGPYRQSTRMTGMMGMAWPLDMYTPQRMAEIRTNPRTRLVFTQAPITPALKDEAMAQKEKAVRLIEESIILWRGLKGKMGEEDYNTTLVGLEGHKQDAMIFCKGMDLYMDWKLGVLTEERIDKVLEEARGLNGIIVPDPLSEEPEARPMDVNRPASLKTFAEQLRRDLHEPWIEQYWLKKTKGVGAAYDEDNADDPWLRIIKPSDV